MPPATGWDGNKVRILNHSGADCDAYDVLAIDDVLITPEDVGVASGDNPNPMRWAQNVMLKGVTPDLSGATPDYKHIGAFAVLLEPIPHRDEEPKASGLAIVNGITVAQLDMVYEDHPRADVADGTRRLTSNWHGAAQIIYKQQQEDESWWGLVRIGNWQTEFLEAVVDETYGIDADGNGEVLVYWAGEPTDPEQRVIGYLDWLHNGNDLPNNTRAWVHFDRSKQEWVVRERNC